MSLIKKANKEFKNKNFVKALELYEKASEAFGVDSFKYNIDACKKELNKDIRPSENLIRNKNNQSFSSPLNNYFDHIYIVNLKHKVDDRLKVAHHLTSYGVDFEIFEATNGYQGEPLQKWNEYKQRPLGDFKRFPHYNEKEKKHKKHFIESAGAIGYIYTYIRILKDAKLNGYKRFLILEDDILLCNNFNESFNKFIDSIDDDWKVLHLGASQYGWNSVDIKKATNDKHYIARTMDTKGSYAIAFDLSIVDEVIEHQSAFKAPFDHIPMGEIYESYIDKCFVAFPYIVMPDVSESSIRGKRCQYTHSKRMKWDIENYNYPLNKPSISILISNKRNLKYLKEFSNIKETPFILKLFFNSSDGLRPLHNTELLELEFNVVEPINYNSIVNESDYIATINEGTLTEDDIVIFIEYKTNIHKLNTTHLQEITASKPKIVSGRASVIVPTYKRSKNLYVALESVVKQDYSDIELIVVSDNGKDSKYNKETIEIVDSLKKVNSNCKVILLEHSVNRNGSAARNTGILHSTGEFISFLDDDDMYLPGRLSKTISVLKKERKNIGAVYCGFLGWNSPENDLNRYQTGNLTLEILQLEYKKHYLHTNTATYRREAILNINGFDESYRRHQDLEFNLRFFEQYEISACKEALVRLNPEPSDVSNKAFNTVMLDLKFKFLTQFKYLIENYPLYTQYEIYNLHQNEALKYIKEKNEAVEFYKNNFKGYNVQMLMKLAYSINPKGMSMLNTNSNQQLYKKNQRGFYRIIGNNMPSWQSNEQLFLNIVKIVKEESSFNTADKYFVINRIIDKKLKEKIVNYLKENDQEYLEILFDYAEFKKIGYSFNNVPDANIWFSNLDDWNRLVINTELREAKNRYIMNNNGARNFAVKHGKKLYRWTMPWDGNCFISDEDYNNLENAFQKCGKYKYIATPMQRITNNSDINKDTIAKFPNDEPQISFRDDSIEMFNEERVYGNQPKIEFFKQIGFAGKWDNWQTLSPWTKLKFKKSKELGVVTTASAMFRLSSGNTQATMSASDRNITRKKGICDFLDQLEVSNIQNNIKFIKYKVDFPKLFKGYITNSTLKDYNNKLIWAFSSKNMTEKTIVLNQKMIKDILITFNTTNNSCNKLYSSIILFSYNLMSENKLVFTNDIKLFIDNDFQKVYNSVDLSKIDDLQNTISNVFIAMLFKLTQHSFIDAIKLKVELSMLLYYYFSKKEELRFDDNVEVKNMISIIDIVFKEVFNYSVDADIKLIRNKN